MPWQRLRAAVLRVWLVVRHRSTHSLAMWRVRVSVWWRRRATAVIKASANSKINDGDTVLTFGHSDMVESVLKRAYAF